jgi:ribosome-associated protein
MIRITRSIALEEAEIEERFIRAPGPGGQNVNKTATAVQLRFEVGSSPSLPQDVKHRLRQIAGKRINSRGVLIIEARRFREQPRNREDARERLANLIRKAAEKPVTRLKTRPTLGSKQRRLDEKQKRGNEKKRRRRVLPD